MQRNFSVITLNPLTIPRRLFELFCRPILKSLHLIFIFLLLIFLPSAAFPSTNVSGTITSNTAWTISGSPYIVVGNVIVDGGNHPKLKIDPGVVVKFNSGYTIQIGNNLGGSLEAIGTADSKITFTSNSATPSPGDWCGILFDYHSIDGSSVLDFCTIEYGGATKTSGGYTFNGNINCRSSSPTVKRCLIRKSLKHGICIRGNSDPSNPYIGGTQEEGNTISENTECGIWIYNDAYSQPVVTHNTITNNGTYAIQSSPIMPDAIESDGISNNSGSGNGINGIAVNGNVTQNSRWRVNDFPYIVTDDIIIDNSTSPKLLIDPGVVVKFNSGYTIQIGNNLGGSLEAIGTADSKITFTSNSTTPSPGDWCGILFNYHTIDASSVLDFCTIEYGGASMTSGTDVFNGDINFRNASPKIERCTIRNSFKSGIQITGAESNSAIIYCNNLKDNLYGIYLSNSSVSQITDNNFFRNQQYGLYSTAALTVSGNWWSGNGQNVNSLVTLNNPLSSESICIGANDPPLVPSQPNPANGSIDIPVLGEGGVSIPVTLSWVGTDPDTGDTLIYDLYFGNDNTNLMLKASNLSSNNYSVTDLNTNATYYWKVIARDNYIQPAETSGPVWNFTTSLPDLTVSDITWSPSSDIESGQPLTFSATVQNLRNVSFSKNFSVVFKIDGAIIGTQTTGPIPPLGSTNVTKTWTAAVGKSQVTVNADSSNAILEANEQNNTFTKSLPPIGDKTPPENVTNITVESFLDKLIFHWTPSADTAGDLAGYKIYFDGVFQEPILPKTQNTYQKDGLTPSHQYAFKITAIDDKTPPNENTGVTRNAATILANNPVLSAPEPFSGYVKLTWNTVPLASQYWVYYNTTSFSSVEGMTPVKKTTGTSATISGLTNGVTYNFAVTAINISGGENKSVNSVAASPVADTQGPAVSNILFGSAPLTTDPMSVTTSGTVSLSATDTAGISRVEFKVNDALMFTDYKSPYNFNLDLLSLPNDGTYTLQIIAYDTFGNSTTETRTINVTLSPPPAPVITSPVNNYATNLKEITVNGTAEKNSAVTIYRNDTVIADISADATGKFSAAITLATGANPIKAKAANRAGSGPFSNTVSVTLDTTIPLTPTHLSAQSKENGQIGLSWQKTSDTNISGYNIYRSGSSFSSIGQASKINTKLVTSTLYTDLTTSDGTYYYRVTAVNAPGNESELSAEASAVSDSVAPVAQSISYFPQGKHNEQTGAMATGRVDVILTVSEKLMAAPFLTITPEGGIPISVTLAKDTDTRYTGSFTITDATVSGTAWAVFSARDEAGNRGTHINQGESILIDTDGPAITRIALQPANPIKNDAEHPVTITATFGLNDAMKSGESPDIKWLLSGTQRDVTALTSLSQIDTQSGDIQTWQGELTLPANAGLTDAETLSFMYTGKDYLDNLSDRITCLNAFQVYQGNLPPLDPPLNFTGKFPIEAKHAARILELVKLYQEEYDVNIDMDDIQLATGEDPLFIKKVVMAAILCSVSSETDSAIADTLEHHGMDRNLVMYIQGIVMFRNHCAPIGQHIPDWIRRNFSDDDIHALTCLLDVTKPNLFKIVKGEDPRKLNEAANGDPQEIIIYIKDAKSDLEKARVIGWTHHYDDDSVKHIFRELNKVIIVINEFHTDFGKIVSEQPA